MEKKKRLIILITTTILVISIIVGGVIITNLKDDKTKEQKINSTNYQNQETEENDENEETSNEIKNPEEETKEEENTIPDNTTEGTTSNKNQPEDNNSNPQESNSQVSNNEQPNTNNENNNQQEQPSNSQETQTPEESEETTGPTIVNTSSINLSNYNNDLKITKGGTYTLTGKLNNTLYIESSTTVTLNLNGITIKSTEDAAIANINNNDLIINLNSGTTNILSDNGTETDYDASLYSNGHLTINGTGILRVVGNRVDDEGIATKNAPITINNGAITIVTKDDGINTGGDGGTITINGGVTYIDAGGDGIDSNKDIIINGGTLYTTGSSTGNYSGLDADSGVTINGGNVIATGSSYLQIPLSSSKQKSLSLGFSSYNDDEIIYALVDATGNEIISFMAKEKFQGITISSDKLTNGTYYLYRGGTHSGTLTNYIYNSGTYTPGEMLSINSNTSFSIEINSSSYTDPSTNIMGINNTSKITKKIYKQNINMNVFIPSLIISTLALSLIAYKLNKKIVK